MLQVANLVIVNGGNAVEGELQSLPQPSAPISHCQRVPMHGQCSSLLTKELSVHKQSALSWVIKQT